MLIFEIVPHSGIDISVLNHDCRVPDQSKKVELKVHVAIVACGDRAPEAINSLKSFAILSKVNLHFHIFAEEELHNEFKKSITAWPRYKDGQIEIEVLPIQFPGGGDFDEWKKLFKPCASQRMFLPVIIFFGFCFVVKMM